MNKQEFLNKLYLYISKLPETEKQKTLDYYSEIIDDRIEEGMTEEEAVAALGDINTLAEEVKLNHSQPTSIKQKAKKNRVLKTWEIIFLIIGAPLWLSILLAILAVILSFFVSLWAVIISLYATAFSLAVCLPATILGAVVLFAKSGLLALFALGAGLILGGLSLYAFVGINALTKLFFKFNKLTLRGIKSIFVSKEEKQ